MCIRDSFRTPQTGSEVCSRQPQCQQSCLARVSHADPKNRLEHGTALQVPGEASTPPDLFRSESKSDEQRTRGHRVIGHRPRAGTSDGPTVRRGKYLLPEGLEYNEGQEFVDLLHPTRQSTRGSSKRRRRRNVVGSIV